MKNCDLHTHSYYSDGKCSPKELVRLAKKQGIKYLALTDHNSMSGVKEAVAEGNKIGVEIVPGVELRSKEGEVLAYFVDVDDKSFLRKIKKIQDLSKKIFENLLKKLRKRGIDIKSHEVLDTELKSKNVLAAYLIEFLKQKNAKEIQQVRKMIKGNLFEPHFSTENIIGAINDAGGIAILSHPWHSKTFLNEARIKQLVRAGLKGIEIDNGGKSEELKDSLVKIRRLAKKYDLILTSGSDYHGKSLLMPSHKIGAHNCDEKVVLKLKKLSEKL